MLIESEKYTDENGVERQKDYFGPNKDAITSIIDSPVPQEIDYSEPTEAEQEISGEEIQAQILLNQADIIAKQQEQDEVLAAILLNQIEGGETGV